MSAHRQTKWICAQIGAREHYAVPRALHRLGALDHLITDAWVRPGNLLGGVRRGLGERFHPELADAHVRAPNFSNLSFELRARARGLRDWPLMVARNDWFQQNALSMLSAGQSTTSGDRTVVFAYSYAALDILRFARSQGWPSVLGQIDPGPVEESIVARLWQDGFPQCGEWQPPPPSYWERWREECTLADRIVVNSDWSRTALLQEGVSAEKLRVIPLSYELPQEAASFQREYPDAFNPERPLRVLFLGLVNLRKAMGPILDALRLLDGDPIEFEFVGPIQIRVPEDLQSGPRIHWRGSVPRSNVGRFYRRADIFLFPTMSDGFGITQLEAQAWKLPVIASRHCGDVIEDGRNGLLLAEITGESIATVLRRCLANPVRLREMSANSLPGSRFGLSRIAEQLLSIFD
jgi:glycosyltransferase involved in cell wall biosynthesis